MNKDDALIARRVYRIRSRNLNVAVWNGHTFVGIREKAGSRFLDSSEVSWKVLADLGSLPESVESWAYDFDRRDEDGYLLENVALFDYLNEIEQNLSCICLKPNKGSTIYCCTCGGKWE